MDASAPGRLAALQDFVNTLEVDEAVDELTSPAALAAWLSAHGLLGGGGRVATQDDLARARRFREALRELLFVNHGPQAELSPAARRTIEAESAACPLRVAVVDARPALEPLGDGIDGAIAALLAIWREAVVDGSWERLKACPEATCQWAFYDTSRNRSRRWCGSTCGTRANVRAYRERQRAEPDD